MLPELELALPEPLRLSDAAEVALEDYARELTRSGRAVALRGAGAGGSVSGVRLEEVPSEPDPEARRDILAFAQGLADAAQGSGLGWT